MSFDLNAEKTYGLNIFFFLKFKNHLCSESRNGCQEKMYYVGNWILDLKSYQNLRFVCNRAFVLRKAPHCRHSKKLRIRWSAVYASGLKNFVKSIQLDFAIDSKVSLSSKYTYLRKKNHSKQKRVNNLQSETF